jgi:hypothetical protein
MLARQGELRVNAVVLVRDAAGNERTIRRTLTVRAARP